MRGDAAPRRLRYCHRRAEYDYSRNPSCHTPAAFRTVRPESGEWGLIRNGHGSVSTPAAAARLQSSKKFSRTFYYSALLVREDYSVEIFEETTNVAVP